jgi:hypothetical protein
MLFYLRQGQARNYTFSDGFLNSTDPYPVTLPFQAPSGALLINGLWFSSLICSLVTAFFGMLIKQWLNEYLASESMSPKRRIMERHLRQPGLVTWKVYEIAGVLPILLHVALSLFFIGLCLFTASIDVRLGRTCFALVAGWAFIIVITILAPLFSPRCPYKLRMFRTIFLLGRSITRPLICHAIVVGVAAIDICTRLLWLLLSTIPSGHRHIRVILLQFTGRIYPTKSAATPRHVIPKAFQPQGKFAKYGLALLEEEMCIDRISKGNDLEFLLAVDNAVADDTMLQFMGEVVRRSNPSPDETLSFLISLMRNRLGNQCIPHYISSHAPFQVLDLSLLSHDAWQFIMNVTAHALDTDSSAFTYTGAQRESCWPQAAIWILLSQSQYAIPEMALSVLFHYFCDASAASQFACPRGLELVPFAELNLDALSYLSRRFIAALSYMNPQSSPLSTILSVYAGLLASHLDYRDQSSIPHLLPLLGRYPDIMLSNRTQYVISYLAEFLQLLCEWYKSHQDISYSDNAGDDMFTILLLLSHIPNATLSRTKDNGLRVDSRPHSQTASRLVQGNHAVDASSDNDLLWPDLAGIEHSRIISLSASLGSTISDKSMLEFMLDAVRILRPEPEYILPIIAKFLRQRLEDITDPLRFTSSFAMPDLRCFPPSVHATLVNILAETLQNHAPDELLWHSPPWVKGAVVILLSPSQSSLPELPLRILHSYLCDQSTRSPYRCLCAEVDLALAPYILECSRFMPLSQRLSEGLMHHKLDQNMTPCVEGMLAVYRALLVKTFSLEYTPPVKEDYWDTSHFFLSNLSLFQSPSAQPILDDLWKYLQVSVDWYTRFESSSPSTRYTDVHGISDAFLLLTVFGNHGDSGRWTSAAQCQIQAGTTWTTSGRFLISLTAIQPHRRLFHLEGKSILHMICNGHEKGWTRFESEQDWEPLLTTVTFRMGCHHEASRCTMQPIR